MQQILFLSLIAAVTCSAAISDYGARVVQAVNARLDSVPRQYTGGPAGARQHLEQVERAIGECNGQLRLLIRDSREPEVRGAQAKLADLERYAESLKGNLKAGGQSSDSPACTTRDDEPARSTTSPSSTLRNVPDLTTSARKRLRCASMTA